MDKTKINLSEIIKVWDIIHPQDTGSLGFCDVCRAMEIVFKVENDLISNEQPKEA